MPKLKYKNGDTINGIQLIRRITKGKDPKGLFICPSCKDEYVAVIGSVCSGKSSQCKKCGDKERGINNRKYAAGESINEILLIRYTKHKHSSPRGMFECPSCKNPFETYIFCVVNGGTTKCKGCALRQSESKSSIEVLTIVADKLKLDIDGQFQMVTPEGNKYYDGHIRGTKLLLEVDGKYWHQTKKQKDNDAFKEAWANNLGYKVIRVICNNLAEAPAAADNMIKQLKELI